MKQATSIMGLTKNPKRLRVIVLTMGILFASLYWVMSNLPGEGDLMCLIGANLTAENMIFSLTISLMAGFLVAGLLELSTQKKASMALGSTTAAGLGVGVITTFCTVCTLPVLSLFGLGISLSFLNTYELYFKAVSLIMLTLALWLLNKQLQKTCFICR